MIPESAVKPLTRFYYSIRKNENFVLTGIPRSGTSLLSSLLCLPDNCFCFNEIYYDTVKLPLFLFRMKYRLLRGKPVPCKADVTGSLAQDTMEERVTTTHLQFPPKKKGCKVGSNVNIPYLNDIDTLLAYRFKILVLIRNPVFTISSWNSKKAEIIPEANVVDPKMNERWKSFSFRSSDQIGRQAEIWETYARLIRKLGKKVFMVRYEDLVDQTDATLRAVERFLKINHIAPVPTIENYNRPDRYEHFKTIERSVDRMCPIKSEFGY